MLRREAEWIGARLASVPASDISPLLDIGSSDRAFREQMQPYIDEHIFRPQRQRGVSVVHSDVKASDGIDIVGDIFDDTHLARLAEVSPRGILCSNIHEHVRDPAELTRRYLSILSPGGYVLVTVPHSFPYHRDPIDNLFRPTPAQLAESHPGTEVVDQALIVEQTYGDDVREMPLRLLVDVLTLPRVVRDTKSVQHWRPKWLRRPYQVSCVLLRVALSE